MRRPMAKPGFATLGFDEWKKPVTIGDIERRSGLYLLGQTGTGKTNLLKNLIVSDIRNNHGVFFLDPHGQAIDDLTMRIDLERLSSEEFLIFDVADEKYKFGINLLSCRDPSKESERLFTYSRV